MRNDRGVTLVEYALIVALCVLIAVAAIGVMGGAAEKVYLNRCVGNQAPNGVCTLK